MSDELHERIRDVVLSIPSGRVASYGDVAAIAGAPSPRMVGRVLAEDGSDLPWHRVITSSGKPAHHLHHEQLDRLRAEGVLAEDGKVDMRRYRWEEAPSAPKAAEPPSLFD